MGYFLVGCYIASERCELPVPRKLISVCVHLRAKLATLATLADYPLGKMTKSLVGSALIHEFGVSKSGKSAKLV